MPPTCKFCREKSLERHILYVSVGGTWRQSALGVEATTPQLVFILYGLSLSRSVGLATERTRAGAHRYFWVNSGGVGRKGGEQENVDRFVVS